MHKSFTAPSRSAWRKTCRLRRQCNKSNVVLFYIGVVCASDRQQCYGPVSVESTGTPGFLWISKFHMYNDKAQQEHGMHKSFTALSRSALRKTCGLRRQSNKSNGIPVGLWNPRVRPHGYPNSCMPCAMRTWHVKRIAATGATNIECPYYVRFLGFLCDKFSDRQVV